MKGIDWQGGYCERFDAARSRWPNVRPWMIHRVVLEAYGELGGECLHPIPCRLDGRGMQADKANLKEEATLVAPGAYYWRCPVCKYEHRGGPVLPGNVPLSPEAT